MTDMTREAVALDSNGRGTSQLTGASETYRRTRPCLADGTQLLGAYKGSGYQDPPCLVRRRDGQVIQLSRLLYQVAAAADGRRSLEGIADDVRATTGAQVTVAGIEYLLQEKLNPLGLLSAEKPPSDLPRARPLFALSARRALVPERAVTRVATGLRWLFWWPIVAGVLGALLFVDYDVFVVEGVERALHAVAAAPANLLVTVALVVASVMFHELGHATGCRYGGGRPGPIGVGLYIAWPAFYTNVTDAYRLGRAGRLRTDLGGPYFTLVTVVLLGVVYEASGFLPVLLAIIALQLQMAIQLLPIVRFDGYYVLADLVGVPDLFGRIGPILRSIGRPNRADQRVRDLRPGVRRIVTAWVVVVVPLLAAYVGALLVRLPDYVQHTVRMVSANSAAVAKAAGSDDWAMVGVMSIQVAMGSLSMIAMGVIFTRLGRKAARQAGRAWKAGGLLRAAVVAVGSAALGGLALIWWNS